MPTCSAFVNSQVGSPDEDGRKFRFHIKIFLGLFYTLLHSTALLLSNSILQHMGYMNAAELCAIRSFWVLLFCLPITLFSVKSLIFSKGDLCVLVLRGVFMGSAMYFQTVTLKNLPLVETSIICSAVPAFMSFAARFYLKEPCSVTQVLAILLTICGILLSVRLPELLEKRQLAAIDFSQYMKGLSFAILHVLFITAANVLLGKIRHIHFAVTLIFSTAITAVQNAIITYLVYSYELPRCGLDQWLMILTGVFFCISCCSIILAFQMETVTEVVIMKNSFDITLSPLFQVLIFGAQPTMYNLYGGVLVLASTYILCARKIVAALPEGSRNRKRFKFFLK